MCHSAPLSPNVLRSIARNPRALANGIRACHELLTGQETCTSDPVMLQLEVTVRCNFQCRYCIVHNGTEPGGKPNRGDMEIELFEAILDRFPKTFYLQLFGQGEPLLLGDRLLEMIETASRQRRFTALVSNGSLCDASRGRQLLEAGLGAIAFSIDLCDLARMEENRRRMLPDQVEENLRRLVELRNRLAADTSIGVSAVFLPGVPQPEVEAAVARLDALGIDFLFIGPLAGTPSYRERYPDDLRREILQDPVALNRLRQQARCRVWTTPEANFIGGRCIWGWSALYVNHDGSLSYCANNHRVRLPSDDQAQEGNGEESRRGPDQAKVLEPEHRNHPILRSVRRELASGRVPTGCFGCQYLLAARHLERTGDERNRHVSIRETKRLLRAHS